MASPSEALAALDDLGLEALAVLAPDPDFCPPDARCLLLIGPQGGARWWDKVQASPEWLDGAPDPIDRWSKRALGGLATHFGGTALFPSDGPPYPPFFRWAQESGALWQSPVGMLVHARQGLWVSFRGALALPFTLPLPPAERPCDSCDTRPCEAACPAGALSATAYDVPRCHAYLDTPAGTDCLTRGCLARRACPISVRHARVDSQSAYHMSRFHR
ncbi:ferredoxin [Cereibacter sphaeroides]|nr:ferredoxin [Cereibacter sphaeroides]